MEFTQKRQKNYSGVLESVSSRKHVWLICHFYIYGVLLFTDEDTAYFVLRDKLEFQKRKQQF